MLNTGAVVLAVMCATGKRGVSLEEITEKVIKLRRKFEIEDIQVRSSAVGIVSDRLRTILAVFVVRGFVSDDGALPQITPDGEKWMHDRLVEGFSESGPAVALDFWCTLYGMTDPETRSDALKDKIDETRPSVTGLAEKMEVEK